MKLIKHFNTVIKHKFLVFKYSCKLGIPFTGLIHDMSKFHPVEFINSVKYYDGKMSPTIVERRSKNNVSDITMHHAFRNKHHWHYYVDYLPNEFVIARMNYKHSVEYVCDIISASKTYRKKEFKIIDPYDYFKSHSEHYIMHPANKEFVLWLTLEIANTKFKVKKKLVKEKYKQIIDKYPVSILIPYNDFSFKYLDLRED